MKKALFLVSLLVVTGACHKMTFKPAESTLNSKLDEPDVVDGPRPVEPPAPEVPPVVSQPEIPAPPTPEPLPPPPVIPSPVLKAGACADQESLVSCLKCEVPAVPPAKPVLSTKAQKLAKIMSMACQIYNKSYPKDYVAPTVQEIESHLLACSPELYPETPMTAAQTTTIGKLLDEADPSMRLKLFKGLWYQPPASDHYELYFGLDGAEAAYQFCMNKGGQLPATLFTSEYAQALNSEGGLDRWASDPKAQARWREAQAIRQQLLSCFNKAGAGWIAPAPSAPAPAKSCDYRSFDGLYEQGGRELIQNALMEGYKVALETDRACVSVAQVPAAGEFQGKVKIAGYRCR